MSDCMLKSNPQDPSLKLAAVTMLQGSSKLLQANMLRTVRFAFDFHYIKYLICFMFTQNIEQTV